MLAFAFLLVSSDVASDSVVAAIPSFESLSELASTRFRAAGKRMYVSLGTPSCRAPIGFSRAEALESSVSKVADFENLNKSPAASSQLAIAKADAVFEQANRGMCSNDGDIRFARIHVDQTNSSVDAALKTLRELTPLLTDAVPGLSPKPENAEVRSLFRDLVSASRPRCFSNDKAMASARAEVNSLKGQISGTQLGDEYDLAEADVAYVYANTIEECQEPTALDNLIVPAAAENLVATIKHKLKLP